MRKALLGDAALGRKVKSERSISLCRRVPKPKPLHPIQPGPRRNSSRFLRDGFLGSRKSGYRGLFHNFTASTFRTRSPGAADADTFYLPGETGMAARWCCVPYLRRFQGKEPCRRSAGGARATRILGCMKTRAASQTFLRLITPITSHYTRRTGIIVAPIEGCPAPERRTSAPAESAHGRKTFRSYN